MKHIDVPPCAPVLMESTRAMGYSLEAAVADIIDNSIAAGASEVSISYSPYVAVPYVAILDNGTGMDSSQIDDAMRYGSQSSLNVREATDLGRFGLGLKTASLSQCRSLTVISKQGRKIVGRRWDLDEVYKSNSWSLLKLDNDDIKAIDLYTTLLAPLKNGTLVIWEKLDRMLKGTSKPEKMMTKLMDDVRKHLSLVFHRYIAGESGINKISININGLAVAPADPFLIGKSTQFQADENFNIDGSIVKVSTYILPYISNMSKADRAALGGSEGLSKGQGFYIYRNKRLLIWGTWFRMHRKDELSKLARVRVDIPNSLDHLWTLDVKKSSAVPPDVIKNNLMRIVDRISDGSRRAWTFRGKREISDNGMHLWTKTSQRDGVAYNINREHVMLKMLSETLSAEQRKILEDYLKLVEGNLPLNQLYVDLNNEEQINVRKEKEDRDEVMEIAKGILSQIQDSPMKNAQISIMLQTDPFYRHKAVMDMLKREMT